MERNEIIKTLLKQGTQIDKHTLDILIKDKNVLNTLIKLNKTELPPIITENFLKHLSKVQIKILKEFSKPNKLTVNETQDILTGRYDFFKNILSENQDLKNLISINKITSKTHKFSLIGMISEINDSIILEDTTGRDIFFLGKTQSKYLAEDEMIGVVCERQEGVNHIKKIITPDIPLKRYTSKIQTDQNYIFLSNLEMDSPKFNVKYYENFLDWLKKEINTNIIVIGKVSSKKEDVEKFLNDVKGHSTIFVDENNENLDGMQIIPDPAFLRIQELNLVVTSGNFLVHYREKWDTTTGNTIINLLRKRHLNPTVNLSTPDDRFLLDLIPDILIIGNADEATTTNYKGITIITSGSFSTKPIYWKIDLGTREAFKIDFS